MQQRGLARNIWNKANASGILVPDEIRTIPQQQELLPCLITTASEAAVTTMDSHPKDETKLYFLDFGRSKAHGNPYQGRILSCNTDGSNLTPLVEKIGTLPDGLAIDLEFRHIYYSNMGLDGSKNDGFISRVDMDGKNNIIIVPRGITWTPKQLILESTLPKKKMYWSDREGMRVFRANLDGSEIEVLVQAGEGDAARKDARNWCVGIAVDPERRLMYWTQKGPPKGNVGQLYCAGLDPPEGQTAVTRTDKRLLMDALPEPIDLDLDVKENQLYLTDRGDPPAGNTISRINLRNHDSVDKHILVRKLDEAIGLAIDIREKRMFFTDLSGGLYSAKMDGSDEQVIFSNSGDLTGVVCVHNSS